MARVTLQVIEGLERGQIYHDLPTPVTIGREEDNTIRLNDERVSRFHAKLQEDNGRIILTDLDSTNGTRVNGHPVQIRVLQVGDQIALGRCLLVYGHPDEIEARAREQQPHAPPFSAAGHPTLAAPPGFVFSDEPAGNSSDLSSYEEEGSATELFPFGAPPLPEGLRPAQRAELSDFLAYAHEQIRTAVQSAREMSLGDDERAMRVHWAAWQRLLRLELELAAGLRRLADPDR